MPITRGGMLECNERSITGMGYLSLVNTEVNWLLMEFALSRSLNCDWFIIYPQGGNANVFSFVCLGE